MYIKKRELYDYTNFSYLINYPMNSTLIIFVNDWSKNEEDDGNIYMTHNIIVV